MNVIQCFLKGAKHSKNGLPCEDRTFQLFENGVHVIALADGAGNEKYTHSAYGADCVCKTMARFFCKNFDKFYSDSNESNLKSVIATVCWKALERKAEELKIDDVLRLSSTLLVTAVKDKRVIVCHVGDGLVGAYTKSGLKVVSYPDNGEFASSTYFITSPVVQEHMDIQRFELTDEISFFMMSDGVSDYVYDDLNRTLRDITIKMSELAKNQNGEEVLKKIISEFIIDQYPNSDDCSFIVLRIAPEEVDLTPLETLRASGYEQHEDFEEVIESFPMPEQQTASQAAAEQKKKSSPLKIIIPIASSVLIAAAALTFVFVVKPAMDKDKDKDGKTNQGISLVEESASGKTRKTDSSVTVTEKPTVPVTEAPSVVLTEPPVTEKPTEVMPDNTEKPNGSDERATEQNNNKPDADNPEETENKFDAGIKDNKDNAASSGRRNAVNNVIDFEDKLNK